MLERGEELDCWKDERGREEEEEMEICGLA